MDTSHKGCIGGITCDVHNCVYNDASECHAGHITVGPEYASTVEGTACDTFRARAENSGMN
ncbi:MAG: DUF1540 domain-containing protein [Oscillospiraceae bacterium]|nr:DUF1540 domain-containing protein [Oscillospiraceae bacterium]